MHEATGAQDQPAHQIETDMRQPAAKHKQSGTLSMVNVRNSELNRLRLNKGNENEVGGSGAAGGGGGSEKKQNIHIQRAEAPG